ncbi:unnamed protein product [Prorocentrum cordatum]|uniref:Uncharacterized protein n=1 Tax=Prorocentrum cordatum TaxID=2364126 RepID=A0ABN9XEH6_9DINO|nr:unnamed protein product [Polarella glacialis]
MWHVFANLFRGLYHGVDLLSSAAAHAARAPAAASNSRRPSGSGAGSPAAPAERHALARPARGGGGGAAPSRGVRAELSGGLCSCGLLCLEGSRAAGLGPLSRTASPPPAALTRGVGDVCPLAQSAGFVIAGRLSSIVLERWGTAQIPGRSAPRSLNFSAPRPMLCKDPDLRSRAIGETVVDEMYFSVQAVARMMDTWDH